jgi:cytochrome c oxidase subunit 2
VGQCAQFCGTQHAKMLVRVYVDTPEQFAAWVKNQQQPGVHTEAPAGASTQQSQAALGEQVFQSQSCMNCHAIRGTAANGKFGPDLTHFGSRDTLAAGTYPNNPENLKTWIRNPDDLKPGALMPAMQLTDEQYDQLVAYLGTLK